MVYLINDVFDREQDQRHPLKANRPIASGAVSRDLALAAAVALGALALFAAFALGLRFFAAAAAYLVLLAAYSAFLKHIVILDVLTISAGFTLRAAAGAAAIFVPISHWLLVCTTLLALFIALSKRRHELTLLTDTAIGSSADSRRLHPLPSRPDDLRGDGIDAHCLRVLHNQPGNDRKVRHRRSSA